MSVRFLHTGDLHLGMRITRFDESACNRIIEARFEAAENLRAKARELEVDFVLVAGDLFDDHTVSRNIAERAFSLFEATRCPVYIIPGNHDPLIPGGVLDRAPWEGAQPAKNIHVLRIRAPMPIDNATLFPCPLRHRHSLEDPTAWIASHPRSPGEVRIGLAHGSLDLPHIPLPRDDHIIRLDAADRLQLDYLALGHWHKPMIRRSPDGIERVAYCGTHEPMRFPNAKASTSTGWAPYSSDGDADRFQDENRGTALLVNIDAGRPTVETVEVGRLRWQVEERDLTVRSVRELVAEYGDRDQRALTLLRLHLTGVVDAESLVQIDRTLSDIICNRYARGSSLVTNDLIVEPAPDQLSAIAGDGVLSRMLSRLKADQGSNDPATRHITEHALKLLYRLAWEEHTP